MYHVQDPRYFLDGGDDLVSLIEFVIPFQMERFLMFFKKIVI